MDHVASLMSFLIVILVVYASFLSPFTAEARPKLVDHGNSHRHVKGGHHTKPPRPSTPTTVPPLTPPPPPPPNIHNDYWPPPAEPLPPALPTPPAPAPYDNGIMPPSAPPHASSQPPLPQSGDGIATTPAAQPPPYSDYHPWEAETPDWTPPGYFPTNGIGFGCGEGKCWDSQYCNYPCAYCGSNHTCIEEPDYNYDYYNMPPVPSSAPPPQSSSPPPPLPPAPLAPPPPPPTCAEPPCCPC